MTTIKPPTSFLRAFPTAMERVSPQQLTGRLVPYNQPTDVVDVLPDGQMEIYREGFRPGSFAPQVNNEAKKTRTRIGLVHRHEGGLGYLGPLVALYERSDGLYGDIRILPTKADDVEALIAEGVDELSIEFRLAKTDNTQIDADGTRWRTRAHLDAVALEPKGAYRTAQVLAFREALDEQQAEEAKTEAERKAETDRLAAEQAEAEEQEAQRKAAEKQAADDAAAEVTAEVDRQRKAAEEAEAAIERRKQWATLTRRLDLELVKQQHYTREYGITRPGGTRWADIKQ